MGLLMKKKHLLINSYSLFCGAVCIIFPIIAKRLSDSPLDMLHKIQNRSIIPPMWVFDILFAVWFFLLGVSAGIEIYTTKHNLNICQKELYIYKGALFFVCTLFLSSIWYPIFFSGNYLFLSVLLSLFAFFSSMLCTAFWLQTYAFTPAIITLGYSVWFFYVLFISISVFVAN